MVEFLKKNIFIIILSSITLFLGFLTFLTFIDRSFIELNQNNLQNLLIVNILLLLSLFILIFSEIKKSIRNDIDKDGLKSNKKYITYFSLFTLIPSTTFSPNTSSISVLYFRLIFGVLLTRCCIALDARI